MAGQARDWEARFQRLAVKCKALEKENRRLKSLKKRSTSKIMLFLVMVVYFIGFGAGIYAVTHILEMYPDQAVQALIAILSYVGAPTTAAIGFYTWKARGENIIKIPIEHKLENGGTENEESNG